MPIAAMLEQDRAVKQNGLHFSAPPPDITQDVEVVPVTAAQQAEGQPEFRFSPPPDDIVQNVEVVSTPTAEGQSARQDDSQPSAALVDQQIYEIIREVARDYSGDELYAAVKTDPALGLRFGLVLFDQASGLLGKVLEAMHRRDAAAFRNVLGPRANDLRRTLTAATRTERMQPVGGVPLTDEQWKSRFRRIGDLPICQYAQNEVAIEEQFRPMFRTAVALGLNTDRALAMFYDRVVALGLEEARRTVLEAISPLKTLEQKMQALKRLGYDSVGAFQRDVKGLAETDIFGPDTHVEVMRRLLRRGDMSVPVLNTMLTRIIQTAGGDADAADRLERLFRSEVFEDTAFCPQPQ